MGIRRRSSSRALTRSTWTRPPDLTYDAATAFVLLEATTMRRWVSLGLLGGLLSIPGAGRSQVEYDRLGPGPVRSSAAREGSSLPRRSPVIPEHVLEAASRFEARHGPSDMVFQEGCI